MGWSFLICQYMTRGCFPISSYTPVPQITRSEHPPVVTIRFIDSDDKIHEEFMSFIDVSEDTTVENLSKELLRLLQYLNLDPNKMRSQCYDGAGNMAGKIKGVGPRIQKLYPKALPFRCTSHQLNRCYCPSLYNPNC